MKVNFFVLPLLCFHFLTAESNWCEKGISLCTEPERRNAEHLTEFHKHFDVVFIDPSGYLNLCAGMNETTYTRVRNSADWKYKHTIP